MLKLTLVLFSSLIENKKLFTKYDVAGFEPRDIRSKKKFQKFLKAKLSKLGFCMKKFIIFINL